MYLLVGALISIYCVSEVTSQYYYIGQPALFQFPSTFNSFGQPFSPFNSHPQPQYRTIQSPFSVPIPAPRPAAVAPPVPPAPISQTFSGGHNPEYRGFAYQTKSDDGATSRVLFLSGPQSGSFRSFSSFGSPNTEELKARNIASDMVDPIKKTEQEEAKDEKPLPKNIQDVYSTPANNFMNNPDYFFQTFFQDPTPRVINFYSSNSNLFAQPVPGYPADTAPLPSNADLSSFISPRFGLFNLPENKTEQASNNVAQESVITNTRFKLNDFAENPKSINDAFLPVVNTNSLETSTVTSTQRAETTVFPVTTSITPEMPSTVSIDTTSTLFTITEILRLSAEAKDTTISDIKDATDRSTTVFILSDVNDATDRSTTVASTTYDAPLSTTQQNSQESTTVVTTPSDTTVKPSSVEYTVTSTDVITSGVTSDTSSATSTLSEETTTDSTIQTSGPLLTLFEAASAEARTRIPTETTTESVVRSETPEPTKSETLFPSLETTESTTIEEKSTDVTEDLIAGTVTTEKILTEATTAAL